MFKLLYQIFMIK